MHQLSKEDYLCPYRKGHGTVCLELNDQFRVKQCSSEIALRWGIPDLCLTGHR
ncbi:hypothetical protein NQZ68_013429 [Dissostichus eleginoides]|nr:hypothetical protein NQZ68_013429 [Dissostichus eleginoides]